MGEDVLQVEHDVLARARDPFEDLAAAFRNTGAPLTGHVEGVRSGAGELAGALAAGTTSFELSWRGPGRLLADGRPGRRRRRAHVGGHGRGGRGRQHGHHAVTGAERVRGGAR